MNITNSNIIDKIKSGDQKTFKKLFEQFYTNLCNFSYLIIKDRFIAEDIVQSVFIRIWEIKDHLDIHTSIKSYLYSSVKNASLNYLSRDKNVHQEIEENLPIQSEPENFIGYNELSR